VQILRKNKHLSKQLCVSVLFFLLCPLAIGATGVVQAQNVRDAFYTEVIPRLNSEISHEHFEELKYLETKDDKHQFGVKILDQLSKWKARDKLINEQLALEWFPNYYSLPVSNKTYEHLLDASSKGDIQAKRALLTNFLKDPIDSTKRKQLISDLLRHNDVVGAIYFSKEQKTPKSQAEIAAFLENLFLLKTYSDKGHTHAQIEFLLGSITTSPLFLNEGDVERVFKESVDILKERKFINSFQDLEILSNEKNSSLIAKKLVEKAHLLSFNDLERLATVFRFNGMPRLYRVPTEELDLLREKLFKGTFIEKMALMFGLGFTDLSSKELNDNYRQNYKEIYSILRITGGVVVANHFSKILSRQINASYPEVIWDLRWLTKTIHDDWWKDLLQDSFDFYANKAVAFSLRQGDIFTAKYFQALFKNYLDSNLAKSKSAYFEQKESYLLNEIEIRLLLNNDIDGSFEHTLKLVTQDPIHTTKKLNAYASNDFLSNFLSQEYRHQVILNRLLDFTNNKDAIVKTLKAISSKIQATDTKDFADRFKHELAPPTSEHPFKVNLLSLAIRNKFLAHKGLELSFLVGDKKAFNSYLPLYQMYSKDLTKYLKAELQLLHVAKLTALAQKYVLYDLPPLSNVKAMTYAFSEEKPNESPVLLISGNDSIMDIRLLTALLRINTAPSIASFKTNFSSYLANTENKLSNKLMITPYEKRLIAELIIEAYQGGHITDPQIWKLLQSTQSLELAKLTSTSANESIKARIAYELDPLSHPSSLIARKSSPKKFYTAEEIQRSLSDNELFLQYIHGSNGTIVASATRHTSKIDFVKGLSSDDATLLSKNVMESLGESNFDFVSSRKLANLLLPKMSNSINTIFIAPSPELSQLSFTLLKDNENWLISKYNLSITPSPESLIKRNTVASLDSFLGIGSPIVGKALETPAYRGSAGALLARNIHKKLPYLDNAFDELYEASSNFKSSLLLTGQNANEESTKNTLRDNHYSVISFATHAVKPDEVKDLSQAALVLTPDTKNDGLLTTSEIIDFDFSRASLVNLSACNTASKDSRISNEAFTGLVASFFATGANNILAAYQPILDRAGKDFNTSFFASSKAIPLRARFSNAIRSLLASKDPIKSNPNYWGNFVLVGAGD